MLCDKIMDLSQFSLLAVLSIFLAGISEATSWGSNPLDRHDGYDLQRGPVLYEAYYPDDQGPSSPDQQPINPQNARRYFDQARVLEKTYQAFEDPQNGVVYERNSRIGGETLYPDSQESRNPVNLRSSDQAYEVARQLKRFVEGLEQDPSPRNNLHTRNFENPRRSYEVADSVRNFHTSNSYPRMNSETPVTNEKYNPDERLDNYLNIILSAIKKEALEISKEGLKDNTEENVRVSRQQRFVESEDSFDRPRQEIREFQGNFQSAGADISKMEIQGRNHFSDEGRYLRQDDQSNRPVNFGDGYQDGRGPISQMRFPQMENIFQPRPQVISYVFSPSKTATAVSSTSGPPESKPNQLNDQVLGRYGDNLIVNEMKKKVERSDGLGIASIEVSEVPRHKIRHHHGEKPRRNHQRHATAKADK